MGNIIPNDTREIVAKFFAGDVKGAIEMQLKTLDLIKALFAEVNPIPVKTAVNLLGFEAGQCRMPLCEISDTNLVLLRTEMKKYGIL